jgi:hypothetical protein
MKRIALLSAIVASLVAIATPAQAKFVVRLVIDGPEMTDPIELPNTSFRMGCVFLEYCHPESLPPEKPLGPRYTVTQWLEGHTPGGPMMDPILHDLYPYSPEGPWIFTAPGQTWHDWNRIRRVPSGWTPADRSLMKVLRARGLPPEPSVRRITASATRVQEMHGGGSNPTGVLVGVSVVLAGGALLRRPRWRRRSPGV